jgi:hypothetical protein
MVLGNPMWSDHPTIAHLRSMGITGLTVTCAAGTAPWIFRLLRFLVEIGAFGRRLVMQRGIPSRIKRL